jgi:hypothetical protein
MATAVATPEQLEEQINKSQEAVQQQGDIVRSLKANLKDGKAQQVQISTCGCVSCCRLDRPPATH